MRKLIIAFLFAALMSLAGCRGEADGRAEIAQNWAMGAVEDFYAAHKVLPDSATLTRAVQTQKDGVVVEPSWVFSCKLERIEGNHMDVLLLVTGPDIHRRPWGWEMNR